MGFYGNLMKQVMYKKKRKEKGAQMAISFVLMSAN